VSAWLATAALIFSVLTATVAWGTRGHFAQIEVAAAQLADKTREDQAVQTASATGAREGRALQAAVDIREARLADFQVLRAADDAALAAAHADLARAGSCPIPLADLQLLIAGPAVPGGGGLPAHPGAARPDSPAGAVACSTVVETCELARAVFERNGARLRECWGAYDDARRACNAHAP
jgi:hypothetical protein